MSQMHPAIQIVLAVIAVVLAVANYFAIVALYEKCPRLRAPHSSLYLAVSRTFLISSAVGLVCFLYGYFIEPSWPEVTHISIGSPKIRNPIRLIQISDTHSDSTPGLELRLPAMIASERPDIIVFTGDASNSQAHDEIFSKLMSELERIAPTFAVKGNWDKWSDSSEELFAGTGVKMLEDEAITTSVKGNVISIVGLTAGHDEQLPLLLQALSPSHFNLFLYHYPDDIYEAAKYNVDLYCAGHTHGGQVALPFYGAIVTYSKFGKRFERGLFKIVKTWMYVNRGIGMDGGSSPRIRFWARPEITVIDLIPSQPM